LVLAARALVGAKTADVPMGVTVPVTLIPLTVAFRVKDAVVIVAGFIASLKPTVTFRLVGTSTAVSVGDVTLTVGAMVSADTPVVKANEKLVAKALPARSVAPVVIVAV
jgi:MFS superfamily sulfate permease-like transporter